MVVFSGREPLTQGNKFTADCMLDAIPSESLFPLLTAVRTAAPPPPIPIPNFGALNWGDVLEIQGPSGSGKTQLLYLLLATCIMPCSLGGWEKAAVIFDTEASFDPRNFHRVLSCLVRASSRSNTSSDVAPLLAETALHNLHILRPVSTASLAAAIYNLPAYQKTRMPDVGIALVAVDSLSAFYWPDRFTAEQLRPLALPNSSTPLQHVLTALQKFRLSHNPITVLTNWALTVADNSSGPPTAPPILYKQHLPSFPSFPDSTAANSTSLPLTHHITLISGTYPAIPWQCIIFSQPRRRGKSYWIYPASREIPGW
ncbi:Dna repair protein xrcc2-like protein [Mycena venus]|uniref:Dna repair protein xrcc2-like protein n=1 Tax=Mycena venus TaxID=2733690 RepID=A0A8H7CTJ6_9AGAR|nr:Dna repair protein xrcc2-like protein [Mycena venus]